MHAHTHSCTHPPLRLGLPLLGPGVKPNRGAVSARVGECVHMCLCTSVCYASFSSNGREYSGIHGMEIKGKCKGDIEIEQVGRNGEIIASAAPIITLFPWEGSLRSLALSGMMGGIIIT